MTLHAQTHAPLAKAKPSVVIACDMKTMTPTQRKRYIEVLSPALKSARLSTTELADGYAFRFPADAKTFATVSEWIGYERLCCPFFEFDIHVGHASTPMDVRITGPNGVKQLMQADLPEMIG